VLIKANGSKEKQIEASSLGLKQVPDRIPDLWNLLVFT
jgi:hypothetical protein